MKICFQKLVLVGLVAIMITGCSQNQNPPEQSMVVTAANETAARARLHAIAAAEAQYQVESGGEYGTLDQLIQKRYVNDPSNGKLTGYRFEVQVKQGGFQATAVPEQTGISGKRSFYIDETYVMHAADKRGAPATASDPEA
jgi:hypothetical protein